MPPSAKKESSATKGDVPTIDRIMEYMKSKPDYSHSWDEIRGQLYSGKLSSRGKDNKAYHLFYWRTQLARGKIEQEEAGKFKREEGGIYKFVKS